MNPNTILSPLSPAAPIPAHWHHAIGCMIASITWINGSELWRLLHRCVQKPGPTLIGCSLLATSRSIWILDRCDNFFIACGIPCYMVPEISHFYIALTYRMWYLEDIALCDFVCNIACDILKMSHAILHSAISLRYRMRYRIQYRNRISHCHIVCDID